eukprot:TRINITY_DN2288_c0_g1_i1.p1 TRINITY_DN2288_c0_g1~~TRINITY_DN2288_c0_g1_i1.p1  ORF type:complete len:1279 (-),score=289.18 TRINITY_DN2288_c0_g1_i1:51-3611(-)
MTSISILLREHESNKNVDSPQIINLNRYSSLHNKMAQLKDKDFVFKTPLYKLLHELQHEIKTCSFNRLPELNQIVFDLLIAAFLKNCYKSHEQKVIARLVCLLCEKHSSCASFFFHHIVNIVNRSINLLDSPNGLSKEIDLCIVFVNSVGLDAFTDDNCRLILPMLLDLKRSVITFSNVVSFNTFSELMQKFMLLSAKILRRLQNSCYAAAAALSAILIPPLQTGGFWTKLLLRHVHNSFINDNGQIAEFLLEVNKTILYLSNFGFEEFKTVIRFGLLFQQKILLSPRLKDTFRYSAANFFNIRTKKYRQRNWQSSFNNQFEHHNNQMIQSRLNKNSNDFYGAPLATNYFDLYENREITMLFNLFPIFTSFYSRASTQDVEEAISVIIPFYSALLIDLIGKFVMKPSEYYVEKMIPIFKFLIKGLHHNHSIFSTSIKEFRIVQLCSYLLFRDESSNCKREEDIEENQNEDDVDNIDEVWSSDEDNWISDDDDGLRPMTPDKDHDFVPILSFNNKTIESLFQPCSCIICKWPELHVNVLEIIFASIIGDDDLLDKQFSHEYEYSPEIFDIFPPLLFHLNCTTHSNIISALISRFPSHRIGCIILLRLLCAHVFTPPPCTFLKRFAHGAFGYVEGAVKTIGVSQSICIKSQPLPLTAESIGAGSSISRIYTETLTHVLADRYMVGVPSSCVHLLDYGLWNGCFVLVMERCVCSLSQWRSKIVNPNPLLLLNIFRDIVQAVLNMTKRGVVHYDLKCDNILLNVSTPIPSKNFYQPADNIPKFNVRIGDFGEALPINASPTIYSRVRGTECIRPPEILNADNFLYEKDRDRRVKFSHSKSDIWALGCLLYELFTTEFLFSGENALTILAPDSNQHILSKQQKKKLPPFVIGLLEYILQRDLKQRPAITDVLAKINLHATFYEHSSSNQQLNNNQFNSSNNQKNVASQFDDDLGIEHKSITLDLPNLNLNFEFKFLDDCVVTLLPNRNKSHDCEIFILNDENIKEPTLLGDLWIRYQAKRTQKTKIQLVLLDINMNVTKFLVKFVNLALNYEFYPAHCLLRRKLPFLPPIWPRPEFQFSFDRNSIPILVCSCGLYIFFSEIINVQKPLQCFCNVDIGNQDKESKIINCRGDCIKNTLWYEISKETALKIYGRSEQILDSYDEGNFRQYVCGKCGVTIFVETNNGFFVGTNP